MQVYPQSYIKYPFKCFAKGVLQYTINPTFVIVVVIINLYNIIQII